MGNCSFRAYGIMEKKFNSKLIHIISIILMVSISLFIVSCEDDAILEPQTGDDCPAGDSYCNLSLPGTNNYAFNIKKNPTIF